MEDVTVPGMAGEFDIDVADAAACTVTDSVTLEAGEDTVGGLYHVVATSLDAAGDAVFVGGGKMNKGGQVKKAVVYRFSDEEWRRLPDIPRTKHMPAILKSAYGK